MERLSGKVAIVTGAASGIGRATAALLAREGAAVMATDIDELGAQRCAETINGAGARALAAGQDVTDEARWDAIMAETAGGLGAPSVLVNNAGIAIAGALADFSLDDWRRQMTVNLDSVFLGTRAAIRAMRETGGGAIINLSSIAGLGGSAGASAYCASKGGVRLFTKAAAIECAELGYNIRVNSVHPGIIETPLWGKEITRITEASPDPAAMRESLFADGANAINSAVLGASASPLGRAGTADEIAEMIAFLASDAASYCSGQEFVVDGALTASA